MRVIGNAAAAALAVDAQNLCAHIRQQHGAKWPWANSRHFNDFNSAKRPFAHDFVSQNEFQLGQTLSERAVEDKGKLLFGAADHINIELANFLAQSITV